MSPAYKKYFKTIALIWTGCFVSFLMVCTIVLLPDAKNKKNTEKQLTEKKQLYEFAQKAAQEQTRTRLNKELEELRSSLKDFAINFGDSANLIFDISQIANRKKVASFSIEVKDAPQGPGGADLKYICENYIDVSFITSWSQFATFLNALERNRPVVFVDKFTIARSKKNSSTHKASMNLTIFVRKKQDS